MKKKSIAGFGALVLIVFILALPVIRNGVATYQLEHVGAFEAYYMKYGDSPRKVGPVQLNEAQRKQLIGMIDWDYLIGNKSIRGFPSCLSVETLEFRSVGSPDITFDVSPQCETASFSGRVRAGGWSPGSRRGWEMLRNSIFPQEQSK